MVYSDILIYTDGVVKVKSAETGLVTFVDSKAKPLVAEWYATGTHLRWSGSFEVEAQGEVGVHKRFIISESGKDKVIAENYRYVTELDKNYVCVKNRESTMSIIELYRNTLLDIEADDITKCADGKLVCIKNGKLIYVVNGTIIDSEDCNGEAVVFKTSEGMSVEFGELKIKYNSEHKIVGIDKLSSAQ